MPQPHGVAVHLEAVHLCTQMRGVCEIESSTRTTYRRGTYDTEDQLRIEPSSPPAVPSPPTTAPSRRAPSSSPPPPWPQTSFLCCQLRMSAASTSALLVSGCLVAVSSVRVASSARSRRCASASARSGSWSSAW
ncbi:GTP cyclohydrolase I [Streptomyces canus]|uniref:GTP cyclohydrolase I n=1 Tax=Streptomyces canus TaxID=58343 RepID=UPI0038633627